MSRRSPRIRARLTTTVQIEGADVSFVCHTRDVSRDGCLVDAVTDVSPGAHIVVGVLDPDSGDAVEVSGVVTRALPPGADGIPRGFGVRFDDPSMEWLALVARQSGRGGRAASQPVVRLRVLVVGDSRRRRSALALYVQSGWDVRFASDLSGAVEALEDTPMDAVIVEQEPGDPRGDAILDAARRAQSRARRIVRTPLGGRPAPPRGDAADLVHRVIDLDDGLDALVDAITA